MSQTRSRKNCAMSSIALLNRDFPTIAFHALLRSSLIGQHLPPCLGDPHARERQCRAAAAAVSKGPCPTVSPTHGTYGGYWAYWGHEWTCRLGQLGRV